MTAALTLHREEFYTIRTHKVAIQRMRKKKKKKRRIGTVNTWMTPGVGSSPTGAKIFVMLLVPLGKALYSNCSVVRRSRKAIGPVYNLNINTSVHVKERHRLFEKSRGSSRYCWPYFKTTLIYMYSRFQSMGRGRLWPVWSIGRDNNSGISTLRNRGQLISDAMEKCNILNNYF